MTTTVFPLHRLPMEEERINVAKFVTPKPPTLQKNKCKVLRRVVEEEGKDKEDRDTSRSSRIDVPVSNEEKKPTYRFLDLDQRKSSVGMPETASSNNNTSTYVMFEMRNNSEIVCYPVSMYRFRPETDISGTSAYFSEDLPQPADGEDPKEVLSEDLEKAFKAKQRRQQTLFNKKHPRMARRMETGKKNDDRFDKKEDTAGLAAVLNKLNKGKGGAATATGVDDLDEENTNPVDEIIGEDLVQNALSLQDELLAQEAKGRMEETQEQVGDFSELFSDDEDDGVNRADIGTKAFEGYESESDEGGEDVDVREQIESRDARESTRKMRGLLSGRAPKPKAPSQSQDIDDEDEELKLADIDLSDADDDSDTDMTDGPKKNSKNIKRLTQGQIKSSNMSEKEKKAALMKKRKLAATSVAGLLHNTKRAKKSHDANDNKKALYKMLGNEEFLCRLINSNQWTTETLVTRLDLEKADAKTREKFRATFKKVAYINRQTNFLRLKPEYAKRFKKTTSSSSSSSSGK